MPTIEINGKKVEAEAGSMIIEVTDRIRVPVPRFCYHPKLSIAANCRMCLVEVERAPKPLPACATPITEGMKIWTHSKPALTAQKSVMEFLLINHPLDCPICDQGGECELQDLSLGFGQDDSRYTEGKRVVKDKDIGPLIATDLTRCIQCTRCVRFGTEIAGLRELGATGRGEAMSIGTFIEKSVISEVSGNVIDICPVGALTSKPYRFAARGWELKQVASVSPHDCLGSNLYLHIRRTEILRVVPKENADINEVWLSDRDRFSYEGLKHSDRLMEPKIKRGKDWYSATWEEALQHVVKELSQIIKVHGPEQMGALISPNATLEEMYLFQKWMRSLNVENIDHRLRQGDFRDKDTRHLLPSFSVPIKDIEKQSVALIMGANIHKELPLLGLKLRKMVVAGGKVMVINPIDFPFHFEISAKRIPENGDLVLALARVSKAILQLAKKENAVLPEGAEDLLAPIELNDADNEMAKEWMLGEKKIIVVGALAISHPAFSQLMALIKLILELTGAKLVFLTEGANSAGATISGCFPRNAGLNAAEMWKNPLKAYTLFNLEPDVDCLNGMETLQALNTAQLVIAFTPYESQSLREATTVLLPITPFSEMSGTFVNSEAKWQSFKAAVPPLGGSRPGWKVLRVLANLCECPGFEFDSTEEILTSIKEVNAQSLPVQKWVRPLQLEFLENTGLRRIAPVPLYATDGLVRRAASLQKTQESQLARVYLNPALIQRLNLTGTKVRVISRGLSLTLPFVEDNTVPEHVVMIPAGLQETVVLGGPYEVVDLHAV